jgi:hypothetical protein
MARLTIWASALVDLALKIGHFYKTRSYGVLGHPFIPKFIPQMQGMPSQVYRDRGDISTEKF